MPGLDPGIHSSTVASLARHGMGCRVKPGNDDVEGAKSRFGLPLFSQLRNTRGGERTEGEMAATMNKIGVVGAGQMGNGIAHVCALGGYAVALHDVSAERINAGLATIDGNLARQVASGRITEAERKRAINKIQPATSLEQFADVDLAIESVSENEAVKRKIFADLCAALPPSALLATNTSSISITRLAAATDRPERFIGMH